MAKAVKTKQGYLSESELYILWLLSDLKKLLGKDRIDFYDLTSLGSIPIISVVITRNLSGFGFKLQDFEIARGKFALDGFCDSEYQKNKDFCERMPDSSVAKALVRIHSGKFGFADVVEANARIKCYLEFIEFSVKTTKKSSKAIIDFLMHYFSDYLNDELIPNKDNFYEFKKQLVLTYGILKKYVDQYGNRFVFEIAPIRIKENGLPEERQSPFLPIHNLIAIEGMGLIEIERVWISDWEIPPEQERGTYKVRVKIKKKLLYFGDFDPKVTIDYEVKNKEVRESGLGTWINKTKVVDKIAVQKTKPVSTIKVEGNFLVFGISKIPMERGQRKMVELFLKNAKTYRNEMEIKKGIELDINAYQSEGGYSTEDAFRNGLNKIKKKLKTANFPIKIENPETRKYQMVIRYTTPV